jgi:hypothetical protein
MIEKRSGTALNTDRPKRSWWGVNEVKPFEVGVRLPWCNRHRPFVSLHVSQWGYELRGGKSRRILHVQLIWGRLSSDRSAYKVWELRGVKS